MKNFIVALMMGLALIVPASAAQFIGVPTDVCRTYKQQKAEVNEKRPDAFIVNALNDKGVVIYQQEEEAGTFYIASHFNEDGCLDGVLVMNADEYKEYVGIPV